MIMDIDAGGLFQDWNLGVIVKGFFLKTGKLAMCRAQRSPLQDFYDCELQLFTLKWLKCIVRIITLTKR